MKRRSDGWYYMTTFFGASQWTPERELAWGLDVKEYADIVSERLMRDEGIRCEVESVH